MRLVRTCSLLVLAVAGCGDASGEVKGGEPRYDASAPAELETPNPPATEPDYATAPSSTWKGIYRDFFGQRARSSCAGNGTCHGTAEKIGSVVSKFVCADVDGCYTSLTTSVHPGSGRKLVDTKDTPEDAYLFKVVRVIGPDGTTVIVNDNMPKLPRDFAFKPAEIARIQQWIRDGAKND